MDRRGFDFYVYVPTDASAHSSVFQRDLLPREEHLVSVQIKTTASGRPPVVSIKVLRDLVEHPGPAFIVILEVDPLLRPWSVNQAHLIHVDRYWIEEAVRRLWKTEDSVLDSKVSIPVPFEKAKKLSLPCASAFQHAVYELALGEPDTYIKNKSAFKRTVGQSQRPFVAKITFGSNADAFSEVADWSIGLRSKARLPVDALQLFEARFGTSRQIGSAGGQTGESVEIEVQDASGFQHGQPCFLEFVQSRTSQRVIVAARLFSSKSRAAFLPKQFERIRIAAPGLEILATWDDQGDLTFSYEIGFPSDGVTLRECIPIARVIVLFKGNAGVSLRISMDDSPREFSSLINGAHMEFTNLCVETADAVACAQRFADSAGFDDVTFSFKEIATQRSILRAIDGVTWLGESSKTWMSVHPFEDVSPKHASRLVVLLAWILCLGGRRVVSLVAFDGEFAIGRGTIPTVTSKRVRSRLVRAYPLSDNAEDWLADLRGALDAATMQLESDEYYVLAPQAEETVSIWRAKYSPNLVHRSLIG
ncbi:MAG: hypothetical protein Q8S73_13535 [Deltaproteobacteria bacterium]|nr:hypothetical protein [Myxococcales bacterium]MDP3215123.1 hypothetical protein [Deltaproteobacteria bacterium]